MLPSTFMGLEGQERAFVIACIDKRIEAEEKSANMNIEACEAITDWLLSEEGQKFMTEGYMHSVLAGFETVPYDSVDTDGLIQKDMGVDWVRCYTQREEIRTQFQEKVTVK